MAAVGASGAASALVLGTRLSVLVRGAFMVGGLAGGPPSAKGPCAAAAASAACCIFLRWALSGLLFLAAQDDEGLTVGTADVEVDDEEEGGVDGFGVFGEGSEAGRAESSPPAWGISSALGQV